MSLSFLMHGSYHLVLFLQKDVEEAKCWLDRVRKDERHVLQYQERKRVWEEELERREVERDALRGRSEIITLIHAEQREVAQHHAAVLKGKYQSIPPQIVATIWLSLP